MTEGFLEESEVVPDVRIPWFPPAGFIEDGLRMRKLLQIEEGDGLIQPRGVKARIERRGFLEFFQRLLLLLAIHVGNAEIIVRSGLELCLGRGLAGLC